MSTITLLTSITRTALLADLEGLWRRFDEMVATLGPGDWSGKHGQHWTFSDVPYHLAYFDLEVIVTAIKRGLDVPAGEQVLRTEAEQDAWNEIKFSGRPAGTTSQECLKLMRTARQAIRDAVANLSEADLECPVFIPLVGLGWVSVQVALETCFSHTWNHFLQLRFWMKSTASAPSPAQTHRALSYFMDSFAWNMDRRQAAQTRFTAVMEFTGPGGGVWALDVAGGLCCVSEGRAARADIVMSQSPETFMETRTGIEDMLLALLQGKIKVRGLHNLAIFEQLFPIKSLDFAPAPAGTFRIKTTAPLEMLVQANAA